ncbi:MAG: dephospho-CoA kinase, partial [Ignavibacteriales bacterium]|nr:dephospho-CoA kinase [Ignavibacteriales bacterium]
MGKSVSAGILRVGVTGGIGSGKTIVCSLFANHGIPVMSADEIAKKLMQNDKALRSQLSLLLGSSTYRPDGSLDRAYVAAKIFSKKSLKQKVNSLVHPRVEAEIDSRFAAMEHSGKAIGIIEAALIYEAGYDKRLDVEIVVDAPEPDRIKRVVARERSSAEEVQKRIAAQSPSEQKARKADY